MVFPKLVAGFAVTVPETGCVACQKVPVTGVVGAVARETGCVACQKVPLTGCVACQKVPLTGCVACQKVPVTGVVGAVARDVGTALARNCASVNGPVTVHAPLWVTAPMMLAPVSMCASQISNANVSVS